MFGARALREVRALVGDCDEVIGPLADARTFERRAEVRRERVRLNRAARFAGEDVQRR